MAQATPASDYVSIASLVVAIASFIASLVSAAVAKGARKDAESIAERAHDEWAQQKWFDLYFSTNSAYDAMEKLQADSIVQKNGTVNIHGGNYPDRANEVIRLKQWQWCFRGVPLSTCSVPPLLDFVDDPSEMLSKQRLKNLMDAMNDIREKALVDASVLTRVIK